MVYSPLTEAILSRAFLLKEGEHMDGRKNQTHKIVMASLLSALVCVATMLIKIPSPLKGYLNLGDGIVLLCGWLLSPVYGFLAAGIGSGLADLFAGYAVYVPATFVIKGLMAVLACCSLRWLRKHMGSVAAMVLAGILAEIVMVLGYYVFEGVLYGFVESLVNIPANAVQGVAGIILGTALNKVFEKTNLFTKI